ncbi:Tam3-transposase (Ac family) [Handroanthus impetiginosus]|uniref:Tam3-transposase (Ac family) n=1 Tax=Handroanthus impetiginosus TaxID=429701 RepID=A0A2G9HL30_9LAMI|nr:Tam3-transposase (Ac family) [Handroanthus impetiginosus]
MDKFLKRKTMVGESSSSQRISNNQDTVQPETKKKFLDVDLRNLPADPGIRPKISEYHPNIRDEIRRAYLQKGPCQPRKHNFPQRKFGNTMRHFNPEWFTEFGNWLEYSISKDAIYCLCCYLMKTESGEQGSGDAFIVGGFTNWKKKERLGVHIGGPNSSHNQAWANCEALMKQDRHIEVALAKQSDQIKREYRIQLIAVVDCIRFLLRQGLAFRGHDESNNSTNQGNFLELLKFLCVHNETIDRACKNARKNVKLTSPDIQKDIVCAAASETTCSIINDLGNDLFAILVDESRDISVKEQMAVVLRYVDKKGEVIERFLSLVHVSDTSATSLKIALDSLFVKYGLSFSRIRGQGYDGASNMRGEFNGLKSLILKENQSAFYVHYFAHQLQLALVAVAKKQVEIASLFNLVATLTNVVGASCKRRDILREKHANVIREGLENGEISSGRGLNQEITLKRSGDTRWGSHYSTLLRLVSMFSSVVEVLEIIEEDGMNSEQRAEAHSLLCSMQYFEFIFNLHLMRKVLGITHELSQALQRNDQDIVNTMSLVKVSKTRLQLLRDNEWDTLLEEVFGFWRSRRKLPQVSNLHHFQVEIFYQVIDWQLKELNDRFSEINTELLICVACLSPRDSFSSFDKKKLVQLAKLYPHDFSSVELLALDAQLENYILDMRSDSDFDELTSIGELSKKLVKTRKHIVYPLVYLLVKLALILPVATATVERTFSAMNIIKNKLRNRMGDE